MPVIYKLKQNKNAKMTAAYEKWYAAPVVAGVKDINDVAELVQRNCSMKKSDVLAVITETVEVLKDMLQASFRVRLNGLGSFKIGISSRGADKADEFSVSKNIKKLRVIFQPEVTTDASTGKRVKVLLHGASLKDLKALGTSGEDDIDTETTNP